MKVGWGEQKAVAQLPEGEEVEIPEEAAEGRRARKARARKGNLKGILHQKIIQFHLKRLNILSLRPLLEIFLKIFVCTYTRIIAKS